MKLDRVRVERESTDPQGSLGELYLADFRNISGDLRARYAEKVQMCYFDPPYATGQSFFCRRRVGEADWKRGRGSLELTAYDDPAEMDSYLAMMREALALARDLLTETGVIFVHVDWRANAYVRLLMDEIFGRNHFLNEIIWSYQTGGRAKRFFSRKHDTILLYSKTSQYYLDVFSVAERRANARSNHMKRHVESDGRTYRSIRSGGKTYVYYDDDPICPGDVWDDVSHLQQKDPQRTGYDTQKPLRLMERIVRCSAAQGDPVCDLFAGSGTTLVAAAAQGRRFVGADRSLLAFQTARRRLLKYPCTLIAPDAEGEYQAEGRFATAIACHEVTLEGLTPDRQGIAYPELVDSWSAGYLRNGQFLSLSHAFRTRRAPQLKPTLEPPVLKGRLALRVSDVFGHFAYFAFPQEADKAD